MSKYLDIIQEICLPNKYTKWYCNIISKRLQQFSSRKEAKEVLGYVEKHHIVPKAFNIGGECDVVSTRLIMYRWHFDNCRNKLKGAA